MSLSSLEQMARVWLESPLSHLTKTSTIKLVKYTLNRGISYLQLLQDLLAGHTQLNDTISLNIVKQYCLVTMLVCCHHLLINGFLQKPTLFFPVLISYFMFDQGRGGKACLMQRSSPTTRNRAD